MSKLFNALEQIRRNEAYNVSGPGSHIKPEPGRGHNLRLIVLIVVVLAAMAFLFVNLPTIAKKFLAPGSKEQSGALVSSPQPLVDSTNKMAPVTIKKTVATTNLNNQGATLVTSLNYWQGIHLLKKASETDPGQIEPLINLGVALAELGLFGPANRYFSMAYALDPKHQELLENLVVLKEAGLLDRPLSFSLKMGGKGSWSGNYSGEEK